MRTCVYEVACEVFSQPPLIVLIFIPVITSITREKPEQGALLFPHDHRPPPLPPPGGNPTSKLENSICDIRHILQFLKVLLLIIDLPQNHFIDIAPHSTHPITGHTALTLTLLASIQAAILGLAPGERGGGKELQVMLLLLEGLTMDAAVSVCCRGQGMVDKFFFRFRGGRSGLDGCSFCLRVVSRSAKVRG